MHRLRKSVLVLLLALPSIGSAADQVAPAQLQTMFQSVPPPLVLDVRTEAEFAQGHVPQAILIPHDRLQGRLDELDRSREIVVYCRSGRRSTIAEQLLHNNGFRVRQLQGSWQAWQAARLPIESVAASPQPTLENTP